MNKWVISWLSWTAGVLAVCGLAYVQWKRTVAEMADEEVPVEENG